MGFFWELTICGVLRCQFTFVLVLTLAAGLGTSAAETPTPKAAPVFEIKPSTPKPRSAPAAPQQTPASVRENEKLVQGLLTALATNNYQEYVAFWDPDTRMKITEADFTRASVRLGPVLSQNRQIRYFGDLNRRGARVEVWKISTPSGDFLGLLSLKNGKVVGFFVQ